MAQNICVPTSWELLCKVGVLHFLIDFSYMAIFHNHCGILVVGAKQVGTCHILVYFMAMFKNSTE